MRHIFVRPARAADSEQFINWSRNTNQNLFDPEVVKYPTTSVRVAYNGNGPLVYAPIQQPLFLEALAINPENSVIDTALALKVITQDAVSQCYARGSGELYFVCAEPSTEAFAQKHGYEKVPWPLYRMRLNKLEKPENT